MKSSLLQNKRFKFYSIGTFLSTFVIAIALVLTNSPITNLFSARAGRSSDYSIILDSSNKVTSSGDYVQHTKKGSNVTFTYTNVGQYANGHTRIQAGGKLVNKDQITSVTDISAVFNTAGSLNFRTSYDGATWSGYTSMVSGEHYELGTKPYYIELSSDASNYVDLTSVQYDFSCQVNPDASGTEIPGETTWNRISSLSELKAGDEIIFVGRRSGEVFFTLQDTILNNYYLNAASISISSDWETANVADSNTVWTLHEGSTSGSWRLKSNNSNYLKGIISGSYYNMSVTATQSEATDWYFNLTITDDEPDIVAHSLVNSTELYLSYLYYNSKNDEFKAYSSDPGTYFHFIYKKNVTESHTEYDIPVDEVGFEAVDNRSSYTTNDIFDSTKELVVKSVYNDGTNKTLSSSDYTYYITNSSGVQIDTSTKFGTEGVYELVVQYKNYIPIVIQLNVGEYIYVNDISAAMSDVSFTTAEKLSDTLDGILTANIEYSNNTTVENIPYSQFASRNIGIKLLNPKGISYDFTRPFGTAGNWTVKVYDLSNEEIYYSIQITVSAIPVQTISLDQTSATMYVDAKLQLVASVNPTYATNPSIEWVSSNEEVATVSQEGEVTAIALGTTTISAQAVDGSGVTGSCAITVVNKPAEPTYEEVADASQLKTGDVILLTYSNSSVSKELASVTTIGNVDDYSSKPAGLYPLTLETGYTSGTLAMKNGTNYLSWSSGNTLTTSSSVANGSSWTFSGTATITNQKDTSRKLQYNVSSPRFACYTSSQAAPTIYLQTNAAPTNPVYPTSISLSGTSTITIGATSQLDVAYSPSGTNVKNVTFSSNNESIATVSSAGLITGVSVGSATITATAQTATGTTSATFKVTVSPISVESVSLDTSSLTVKEGKTATLTATIYPTNASNKNVTWSSSNTSVATVSNNGVVTGVAVGTATITVTTADGAKKATCTVSVQASGGEETFSITYTDLPSAYSTNDTVYTAASGIKFKAYNCAGGYSSKMQFRASSGYLENTESLELQSITINDRESNELTVYGSNTSGSFSTEIAGDNDVYDLSGYSYFKVARTASGAAYCSSITVVTGTPVPTDPTDIILDATSAEIGVGGSKQLSVSYVPSNANQNKQITWTSSNSKVSVDANGLISVSSTATAGTTATITAKLTNIPSIVKTCTVTVVEQQKDDHTVLIYMCGADLESENQLATGDIQEILKISNQPDDVNIVIETGGAKSWASTYGISSTYLERWHVENRSLVKDDSLTYASMGSTSTLQSFIQYGLKNYPAERTGLVFWNHGGGMRGVCYDEKKNNDVLKVSEIKSAVSGALSNCGMSGQKLEWVGYDACLMAVQDIAEMNSSYFNYMIASEESEAGYGWDYDTWVDDLYAKKTTPTILKAIVDGFIADNGGASSSSGDQTLSYMNLAYASAYKTAWENMAEQLSKVVTSSNRKSFNSAITSNIKHYGDSDYDYFCTFDAYDFVNKLANNSAFSSFRIDSSYTTAVINAHANLVSYNVAQKGAGVSKGLCMYWPNSSQYSDVSTYYTTSETNFTQWRKLCVDRGYHT